MDAWFFEAKGYDYKELKNFDFVSNDEIRSFVYDVRSYGKLFLIGSKGSGKTLLLHKKAYEYFNKKRKESDEPKATRLSDDIVEVLDFPGLDIPESSLLELKDHYRWKDIWTFSVGLITLRKAGIELPESSRIKCAELEPFTELRFIVTYILNDYERFKREGLFRLNTLIMNFINKLNDRYVLFIDGLDQALNPLLKSPEYEFIRENDPEVLYRVWQAAQFGLLLALHSLPSSHNRRLLVFATARKEALAIDDQMSINVSGFCIDLEYSVDQLEKIFIKNIERTPKRHLYKTPTGKKESIYQFFGCNDMNHPASVEKNGQQ
ncbi:MAG: hypothetical protein AAGF87_05855 [Bacteroidota bacterium]